VQSGGVGGNRNSSLRLVEKSDPINHLIFLVLPAYIKHGSRHPYALTASEPLTSYSRGDGFMAAQAGSSDQHLTIERSLIEVKHTLMVISALRARIDNVGIKFALIETQTAPPWPTAQKAGTAVYDTVQESKLFITLGIALSEKQIPRFVGNVSSKW
jgi:hypothetical protein